MKNRSLKELLEELATKAQNKTEPRPGLYLGFPRDRRKQRFPNGFRGSKFGAASRCRRFSPAEIAQWEQDNAHLLKSRIRSNPQEDGQ